MSLPILAIDTTRFEKVFARDIWESLEFFGPEIQVACAAMTIFLVDVFIPRKYSRHLAWLALAACISPAVSLGEIYHADPRPLFLGMLAIDSFANFFKLFFLLGAIPIVFLSYLSKELEDVRMGEYYGLLLSAVLGGMLMAGSNHLLMAFMSLELLSIASYVLVGYMKMQRRSAEASLKYIIYGSVAAGVMGYGLSLFYGLTGTGDLQALGSVMASLEGPNPAQLRVTVTIALLLTFAGLAYKMATIPMHFWCPDVYEGAPTTITAFLSVGSKAAGFALTLRFLDALKLLDPVLAARVNWPFIMIVISVLTMSLGNFAALWQNNLKRMLAYSSIAHAGYMMMGFAILGGPQHPEAQYPGLGVIAYYLLAYLAMNLGAFAVVILVENRLGSVDIAGYSGLGRNAPFLAFSLTIFLFSLIGIPPTAGFSGKWQLFLGVLDEAQRGGWPYYFLALMAVANTAVSVYYYARIIKGMYLDSPVPEPEAPETQAARFSFPILGTALVAFLLFLTFYLFFGLEGVSRTTLHLKILS